MCNRVVESTTPKENEHVQRKGVFKEQFNLLLHFGAFCNYRGAKELSSGTGF